MRRFHGTTLGNERWIYGTLLALLALDAGCSSSPRYASSSETQTGSETRADRRRRGRRTTGGEASSPYGAQPTPYGAQPTPYGANPGMNGGVAQPVTGAQGMLQAADRALRAQRFQPFGTAQQVIANRGWVSFQFPAQPGGCYTAIAVGDAGVSDIDMQVIAPSGATLGEDRNPDIHPTVSFCANQPGTHLARVNMFAGQGNVFFTVYQGPPGAVANLAGVFGDQPAAQAPAAAAALDPATGSRIQAFRAQMQGAGYSVVREPAGVAMHANQTETWSTALAPGGCYAFATFAGPGVTDTDIFLFDGTGSRQIAGDSGNNPDAVIRDICPTTAAQYQLRPRLYQGNGTVWFMVLARNGNGTQPTGTGVATPVGATPAPTAVNINTSAQSGAGGIEGLYRSLERQLVSVGYNTVGPALGGSLAQGANQTQAVTLEQGTCYAIAATGDSTVRDIDLFLTDASNNELVRDHRQDARPVVRVCPPTSGQFNVRLQMVAGEGQYKLGLFRWEGGTTGAGMSGLLFVRNAEVTRILQADNYQGDADFELVRGRVAENGNASRAVNLRSGVCYAFAAVGGQGVNDLNMSVRHGTQTVGEDNSDGGTPVVRYCAQHNGPHQVAIHAASGAGDFVFRVFRQQQASAPGAPNG